MHNVPTKIQLKSFGNAIRKQWGKKVAIPKTWVDAFSLLEDMLEESEDERKVVFIDEMPWMDAPRSGFVAAFEHFWNGWATARKDILLIICGSASSWIINKIFKNRGGLHNRVTTRIHLHQFTLAECEQYAKVLDLGITRNDILEGYMVMGGVPYYWSKLDRKQSIHQNINNLFLHPDGEFRYEFNDLYESLSDRPEQYIKIIEQLAMHKSGMTRDAIMKGIGKKSGGEITNALEDLMKCGFVRKYCHTGKLVKNALFQLIDCYSLFYFQFVRYADSTDNDFWLKQLVSHRYSTWCGLAFERVCLLHVKQILSSLGISGVQTEVHSWHTKAVDGHNGAQIDLLIDRSDNVVSICEMKYSKKAYSVSKDDFENISNKLNVFEQCSGINKGMQPVIVTPNGMATGSYSHIFHREITADDLFRSSN